MKEILKELRIQNRYSQELLAKVLGISRQAYMKYESGEVEPSVEVVRRLSKIYNVSYAYLIDNGNVKFDENLDNSKIEYAFKEFSWNVASPELSYSAAQKKESVASLYENLQYLKQIIDAMEKQIKESEKASVTISKSRTFDKNDFFNKVDEQDFDSTYIDELRENSLI